MELVIRDDIQEAVRELLPEARVFRTRFDIDHCPTLEQLKALEQIAERFGCTLKIEMRSDADFARLERLDEARKRGTW